MTIEQRVERLERQNLRLRFLCMGLGAITLAGCAMGLHTVRQDACGSDPGIREVVRAHRVEVFDSHDRPIVTLAENIVSTGGVVFVNNNRGVLVSQMGAAQDGRGVVWTYTPEGELRDTVK